MRTQGVRAPFGVRGQFRPGHEPHFEFRRVIWGRRKRKRLHRNVDARRRDAYANLQRWQQRNLVDHGQDHVDEGRIERSLVFGPKLHCRGQLFERHCFVGGGRHLHCSERGHGSDRRVQFLELLVDPWRQRDDGDGGRLRMATYTAGPAEGEVVLLLHGEPSWSYLYRNVMARLAERGFRVTGSDEAIEPITPPPP